MNNNITSLLYADTICRNELASILAKYNSHIQYDEFCDLIYRAVVACTLIPISPSYDVRIPARERNFEFKTKDALDWALNKGFNLHHFQGKNEPKNDEAKENNLIQKTDISPISSNTPPQGENSNHAPPMPSENLNKKLIEEEAKKMLSDRGKNAVQQSIKYQNNIKLKEESLRIYGANTYKSRRQASIKIAPELKKYAEINKITPLSDERAQATIYDWILNLNKAETNL